MTTYFICNNRLEYIERRLGIFRKNIVKVEKTIPKIPTKHKKDNYNFYSVTTDYGGNFIVSIFKKIDEKFKE